MSIAESVVERIEDAGGVLRLNGERIRVRLPEDATHLLDDLRAHKDEILSLLRRRKEIPAMPLGVRLVHWEPKPAPVILTEWSVVTDVDRFIRMTLLGLHWLVSNGRPATGGGAGKDRKIICQQFPLARIDAKPRKSASE
jgi:hypothetical protein